MNNISFVGDLCDITTGSLDSNAFVEYGQYPFYTCAEHPLSIDSYAFDDDVVLVAGNNARGNFHVNRFIGKFNAYQRTYILKSKGAVPIDYIYYVLKLALKRLKDSSQGSQTKFLTIGILKEIPVLYNGNVNTIASILATIDSKIELNNHINTQLEQMAKTIYDYWFVQFDFPNVQGKPYKSSGGKMVYNKELKREIPDGWEDGCFEDLGEIVGGSTPSRKNAEFFIENGIAWITPNDLSNNKGNKYITKGDFDITEAGLKNASLKLLPKNSILLSSRAPVGYMAIARGDVTTNQGFKSFITNKGYSTKFVYYAIKNSLHLIEQNSSGSTFKEISSSVLKSLPTILPSKNIVKGYSRLVGSIFEKQNCLELENQQLASLRDWLLPMLMNGQVTVKEAEEKLDSMSEFNQSIAAEPQAEYHK